MQHIKFVNWGIPFLMSQTGYSSDTFTNFLTTNLRVFPTKINAVYVFTLTIEFIRMNKQTQFLEKFVDS